MARSFYIALVLVFCGGCSSIGTYSFDIQARNSTSRPVTVCLAKDGPPFEEAWASPEELAMGSPRTDLRTGLDVIPPGGSKSISRLRGRFPRGVGGYLRGYWGELNMSQLLSRSRGSPDRVDVLLYPGRNDVTFVEQNGRLGAQVQQELSR